MSSDSAIPLEEVIHFLLEAPLFEDLDADELSRVVHIMEIERLGPGETIFREGDRGDAWFVLYEGEVEVKKRAGLQDRVIAKVEPPYCFGEMAILDGRPRSATVRALIEVTALRFPREDFVALLEAGNLAAYKLVLQIARVVVGRHREMAARLARFLDQDEIDEEITQELQPILLDSTFFK